MSKKLAFTLIAASLLGGCTAVPTDVTSGASNKNSPHHNACVAEATKSAEDQREKTKAAAKKSALIGGGVAGAATVATSVGFRLNPIQGLMATLPLMLSAGGGMAAIPIFHEPELQKLADATYAACIARDGKPAPTVVIQPATGGSQ